MMKNILIILFAFLAVSCFGQRKISSMNPATTVNSDAVIPLVQEGSNYKATKENLQKEVVSTATTNTASISSVSSSVSGVAGWTIGLNATLDSMVFTLGNAVYKVPIGETQEDDITAPTVTGMEIGNYATDTIIITMSEAMDTDSSNSSFTLLEDGVSYGIGTPFFYTDDTIKISLDSVAEPEKAYLLAYSRPGLADYQDEVGNKLYSFTNTEVINNISSASDIYAYMLWEGDDTDSMGVMNFTWTGTEAYRTDGSPPQGTYSTSTSSSGVVTTDESHDLGNAWTFAGWWNGGNNSDTDVRYLLSLDEADVWYDYTDGAQYLKGEIGGQFFSSTLQSDATAEYKWTHFAVTYDGVGDGINGYLRTYVNGVNVSSDSLVATDADANGIVNIASAGVALKFFGDYDDTHFYKAVLIDADILELKNNPGIPIGGRSDPPIPEGDFVTVYVEDFEDFTQTNTPTALLPSGVPNDSLEAHITNFYYLGSDDANDPDKADNVDIVSFGGGQVLKSYYPQGQCCTGAASDATVANGGTGVHIEAHVTDATTYYNEAYVSFNMYLKSDFDNSKGFKIPGLRSSVDATRVSSRLMIIDYTAVSGDLNPAYYTKANWTRNVSTGIFETTWGTYNVQTNSKDYDVDKGKWVNVTLRCYMGNERVQNGRVEIFFDGIYFGNSIASIPFIDTDEPNGWSIMSIETFMGGDNVGYLSPQDQYIYFDDLVVFYFTTSADVPRGSTPSAVGRDISGTLSKVTNFPK